MFLLAFLDLTAHNVQEHSNIILNLLTNRKIALIYSVTICEQKTKDCAWSGGFQHKLQHRCFQIWCLPAFITSFNLRSGPILASSVHSLLRGRAKIGFPARILFMKRNENIAWS